MINSIFLLNQVHTVDTSKGLTLLQTAWDILINTQFDLGFGTISMKMIFFAVILFDLLGVLFYKIWGE